ncbi:MAG: BspA family leucine-rich repeat surface protein [Oscillospiraceae bacterium]|nr:BspA family leucine-rich repeat surface protein [Oscillospiraceae bacterium]
MFQRKLRAKNLQRVICVLLVAMLLVGLFPGSAFAGGVVPFNNVIGHVGPNDTFAPWWWLDDDSNTRTVVVGSGTVQGNVAVGFEANISPWNNWRLGIDKIVFTDPDNTIGTFNLTSLFRNLPYLITIENIDYIDITATRWMEHMFRDAVALEDIYGLENWDTSDVLRFSSMFRGTSFTTLDVSTFDMSSALRLDSMFRGMPYLTEIIGLDEWDTSTVLWMSHMFRDATGFTSLDLSNWDTGSVTTFESMFQDASSLEHVDLSDWDTSSATNFISMFRGASALTSLDLSGWDTRNATTMANMFTGANSLRELTLGPNWTAVGNLGLVTPPGPRYTGYWINVGGNQRLTPAGLMTGPAGAGDTWVWEEAFFNVEFNSGPNGTIAPGPVHDVIVRGGDILAENDIPTPIPDTLPAPGYMFVYWESSTGSTYTTEELLDLPIIADRIFTAIFEPSNAIRVTFFLSGGLYGGDTNPVYHYVLPDHQITTARVPVPTRPGWNFLGWRENGTGPLLSRAQVAALTVTESRSFTAQWQWINQGGPEPDLPERQAYLIGTDEGLIRPNANITRAEVATIFFRLVTDEARIAYWMQENPFSDVELYDWFNNAVSTMTNANVFNGLPDGTFAPTQPITRAEMAAVIVRFMDKLSGMNLLENHFNDIAGHWAADYINAAAMNGWVQGPYGLDGAFYPDRYLKRADAAAMINRISDRLQERMADLLPNMVTWPDNEDETAWYYFYIQSATNSYTFERRGLNNAFERWLTLLEPREWTLLERPESEPEDIM